MAAVEPVRRDGQGADPFSPGAGPLPGTPGALWAHPSSWSNRALRDLAEAQSRRRWQTSDADLALRIAAALTAVHTAFPHLSPAAILDPPHRWFDAALARQILAHVLEHEFETPRRVIAAVSLMSREALIRGGRVIAGRVNDAHFAQVLGSIRAGAGEAYRSTRSYRSDT